MLKARLAAMQGTKKIKKKESDSENESDSDSP